MWKMKYKEMKLHGIEHEFDFDGEYKQALEYCKLLKNI